MSDQGVHYKDYKGEKNLLFEEIKQIKFPSTTAWLKIIGENTKISIHKDLDDMDLFLKDLKNALDKKGLGDRYDHGKMFNFIRRKISSKLLREIAWNRRIMPFASILFPFLGVAVICGFISGAGFKFTGIWLLISLVYFILAFAFYTRLAQRHYILIMKNKADEESLTVPPRNPEFEEQLGLKYIFWGGIVYVILTMGFFLSEPVLFSLIQLIEKG